MEHRDLILRVAIVGRFSIESVRRQSVLDAVRHFAEVCADCLLRALPGKEQLRGGAEISFLSQAGLIDPETWTALQNDALQWNIIAPEDARADDNRIVLSFKEHYKECELETAAIWLAGQADIVLLFGASDQTRAVVAQCDGFGTPIVLLQNGDGAGSVWVEHAIREGNVRQRLEAFLNEWIPMKDEPSCRPDLDQSRLDRRLPLGGLYKRYMKKFPMEGSQERRTVQSSMDKLRGTRLTDDAGAARDALLAAYRAFDGAAIRFANRYWSSIYLRAVIPLITTIALAIGFYIETILGPWPVRIAGSELQLWSILAGLGFFTHALLNFYVYRLSKSRVVSAWHKGYIDNRFVAEALRLAVYFVPFGIPVNFRTALSVHGSKVKPESETYRRLRCAIRLSEPVAPSEDPETARLCLERLNELMEEQIDYHRKTANRFAAICQNLERYGRAVFYIGFGFVLLRGCLQLLFGLHAVPAAVSAQAVSMAKSYANMLALLIPTWASYFLTKMSLCGFKNLYRNNASMLESLTPIQREIRALFDSGDYGYGDLARLSALTASTMFGEIAQWYGQIEEQKVTRL